MNEQVKTAISDLQQNAGDVKAEFSGLNVDQLNWRPTEKSWSVAQCLDHLIVTHSMYFPIFEKIAAGEYKATLWQKISPLSGFFGRFLVKSLDPNNLKPIKTASKAYPSSSEIDAGIIDRFVLHQKEMIKSLKKLPDGIDTSVIVTSPLMGLVTYSLADTLTFVPMHCRRHFLQAKRVAETPGFPNRIEEV